MQKLKDLIRQSKTLDEASKATYLKLIELLPEDKIEKLKQILEEEANGTKEIKNEQTQNKSELNNNFIAEFKDLYKKEKSKVVAKEEAEEKEKSENILQEIINNDE